MQGVLNLKIKPHKISAFTEGDHLPSNYLLILVFGSCLLGTKMTRHSTQYESSNAQLNFSGKVLELCLNTPHLLMLSLKKILAFWSLTVRREC